MIPVNIRHNQYDKLVDNVYYLGGNVVLNMNVILNTRKKDGNSYNYHNEYMYDSEKYLDHSKLVTLKRSFDYFLSLENAKSYDGDPKESIMIRPQDYYNIQYNLEIVRNWFNSQDMYAYKGEKLHLINPPRPVTIAGLAAGKSIVIEPTVIIYENGEYEGVRLYLNNTANYADITLDRIMGFIYTMNVFNMYGAAQAMLAYHGRPPSGDNVVVFGQPVDMSNEEIATSGAVGRKIPKSKKQKSFFDTIDDM